MCLIYTSLLLNYLKICIAVSGHRRPEYVYNFIVIVVIVIYTILIVYTVTAKRGYLLS